LTVVPPKAKKMQERVKHKDKGEEEKEEKEEGLRKKAER
jgi:hypothetical protein